MIIYFLRNKLPWQAFKGKNNIERYIKTYKLKREIKPEILCSFLPKEMTEYMEYVQRLGFEQEPDYKYLQKLFESILHRLNPNPEKFKFSWIKKSNFNQLKEG